MTVDDSREGRPWREFDPAKPPTFRDDQLRWYWWVYVGCATGVVGVFLGTTVHALAGLIVIGLSLLKIAVGLGLLVWGVRQRRQWRRRRDEVRRRDAVAEDPSGPAGRRPPAAS